MKSNFKVTTRTIVATGLGAALFTLLFMYVKIPTGIPETQIQTAYGVGGMFAALFGPIAGGLIHFIGHALSDAVQYGSVWWSWVIASGISGFGAGLSYRSLKVEDGVFGRGDIVKFNLFQAGAHVLAWVIVAPVLDIVIYAEPANLVFVQGVGAAILNIISTGVIGTLLLLAYSRTRSQEGSLTKGK